MFLKEPLVSIIIPVYNVERYIEQCLNSIINQTYKNIEIIVVNDGSTDQSDTIIKRYKVKDKRIKYFNKSNGGLSSARNYGIKKSAGAFLMFVDSDDYVDSRYVSCLIEYLIENNCDIVICGYFKVIHNELIENKVFKDNKNLVLSREELWNKYYFNRSIKSDQWSVITAWTKIYKRSLFNYVNFENYLYEDEFLAHKIYHQCNRIGVLSNCLYFYRSNREGSILNKMNFDDFFYFSDMYLNERIDFFKLKKYSFSIKYGAFRESLILYYYRLYKGKAHIKEYFYYNFKCLFYMIIYLGTKGTFRYFIKTISGKIYLKFARFIVNYK